MAKRRSSRIGTERKTIIQRSREMSSQEKAIYHQIAGAGKSRVKRKFFELSDGDIEAIAKRLDAGVTLAVQRAS
jgi:hypothetical protein